MAKTGAAIFLYRDATEGQLKRCADVLNAYHMMPCTQSFAEQLWLKRKDGDFSDHLVPVRAREMRKNLLSIGEAMAKTQAVVFLFHDATEEQLKQCAEVLNAFYVTPCAQSLAEHVWARRKDGVFGDHILPVRSPKMRKKSRVKLRVVKGGKK